MAAAMGWYWVSYVTVSDSSGGQAGYGAIELELSSPPRDMQEVLKVADHITDVQLGRGNLRSGHHVAVMAWSRMGDR